MGLARRRDIVDAYLHAKAYVIEHGYIDEIIWQNSIDFKNVTESNFLAEAAWVVLASGMRESVVRKCFGSIGAAFHLWHSAGRIAADSGSCISSALSIFGHVGKIKAIAAIATGVDAVGFDTLKREIASQGVVRLREFPYMGPATSYHLAKNLGMDVVKPDRHLLRITDALGYPSPETLCTELAEEVEDRICVVDLVLWRYATLVPNYQRLFAEL